MNGKEAFDCLSIQKTSLCKSIHDKTVHLSKKRSLSMHDISIPSLLTSSSSPSLSSPSHAPSLSSPSPPINFYIIICDGHRAKEKASQKTLSTLAVASASQDCSDGFNFLAKLTTHVYTRKANNSRNITVPNIFGIQTNI